MLIQYGVQDWDVQYVICFLLMYLKFPNFSYTFSFLNIRVQLTHLKKFTQFYFLIYKEIFSYQYALACLDFYKESLTFLCIYIYSCPVMYSIKQETLSLLLLFKILLVVSAFLGNK